MVRLVSSAAVAGDERGDSLKPLQTDIEFLNRQGMAIVDDKGIRYLFDGVWRNGNRITFPSPCWGAYPFYFSGNMVPAKVKVTNAALPTIAKCTLVTEINRIGQDGSYEQAAMTPTYYAFEVPPGEMALVNASFSLPSVMAEGGLNRFTMSLYYHKYNMQDTGLIGEEHGLVLARGVLAH